MHQLILWAGFLGAWCLVAGPLYQATLELRAEDVEFDRIRQMSAQVPAPPPTSRWWWLLPPVHYWLARRRSDRIRDQLMLALPDADFEALTQFINKATGWFVVGFGGLLIALKETYELVHGSHWPELLFWIFDLVMAVLCIVFSATRMRWADDARSRRAAGH